MNDYKIELGLYQNCLLEIKLRLETISDHINNVSNEKYLMIEIETVCLQFRKVLEKIALMSLVANKDVYAEQNEKFARHYHAGLILKDLERVNPYFYPVPIKRIKNENDYDQLVEIDSGFLTKEEFVKVYEKCGGMMHAENPFASPKPVKEIQSNFKEWLDKIYTLVAHHKIAIVGGNVMLVALLERSDNKLPQAVLFEKISLSQ